MLNVAPRALLGQELTGCRRQSELPIQFPVRHQTGVGADLAAHKLQPHPSIELKAQLLLLAFTHWVPPAIIAAMPIAVRLRLVSWHLYRKPSRSYGQCGIKALPVQRLCARCGVDGAVAPKAGLATSHHSGSPLDAVRWPARTRALTGRGQRCGTGCRSVLPLPTVVPEPRGCGLNGHVGRRRAWRQGPRLSPHRQSARPPRRLPHHPSPLRPK